MALLLPRCQHSCNLLLHNTQHHKLAQHLIPFCLRSSLPRRSLHSPQFRPYSLYPMRLCLHTLRELDTIRRNTNHSSLNRPNLVWPNPDRLCPAFRSLSTYPLLFPLVQSTRKSLRDGRGQSREPAWRSAWPAC